MNDAPYALIRRCNTCGFCNAVDLDGTPENEMEMQLRGHTTYRVTREDAIAEFRGARKCDHKGLIAELRAEIERLKS